MKKRERIIFIKLECKLCSEKFEKGEKGWSLSLEDLYASFKDANYTHFCDKHAIGKAEFRGVREEE